jgi:hypothetical protein
MTKTYAARQLLALGPLSFGEFVTVTGWTASACRRVLSYLVDDLGEVSRLGRKYQLPDLHPLEAQGKPIDGKAPLRPVCAGSSVGVSAAASDMRPTHAGCCGRCSGAGGVEREGVKHG